MDFVFNDSNTDLIAKKNVWVHLLSTSFDLSQEAESNGILKCIRTFFVQIESVLEWLNSMWILTSKLPM